MIRCKRRQVAVNGWKRRHKDGLKGRGKRAVVSTLVTMKYPTDAWLLSDWKYFSHCPTESDEALVNICDSIKNKSKKRFEGRDDKVIWCTVEHMGKVTVEKWDKQTRCISRRLCWYLQWIAIEDTLLWNNFVWKLDASAPETRNSAEVLVTAQRS